MPISILFWVIFIVVMLFDVVMSWPLTRGSGRLAIWVLIFLLGWRVFGFVVTNQ